MDDQPAANAEPERYLDSEQIIALEPRFGAWLDQRAIPAERRAAFLSEGWAGQFYGEAVIAGNAAGLGPFLAAIDAAVRGLKKGYGWQFADQLVHTLSAAKALDAYTGDELPPTLRLTWHEWFTWDHYQSRHDTWSYGAYNHGPPDMSGY
jgi:hypothetical protein